MRETRYLIVLDLKYAISERWLVILHDFPTLLCNTIHTLWALVSMSAGGAPPALPGPRTVKPERHGNPQESPVKSQKREPKRTGRPSEGADDTQAQG